MKGTPVIYKGKSYSSIKQLCEAYGVCYSMVIQRLKLGWTVDAAVDTPLKNHRNGKKIKYEDKEYPSLRNLALSKKMPYHVLQMRVKNGMSIKKAVETPVGELMGNETTFNGKTYPSFSKMCKAYDKPSSIVLSRMGMGWSLERALTVPVRKTKNNFIPDLTYDGKTYKSLKALCDDIGADYQNTLNRLHRGKNLKDAIEIPKRNIRKKD